MSIDETVAANCRRVREQIDRACRRAERDPAGVTLVAVTKYARLEWVRAYCDGELNGAQTFDLGEARPQQLVARAAELRDPRLRWHLIGPLQRNKIRAVLPEADLIHSCESLRLLQAIERIAGELDLRPRVLLEVNLARDEAKHGFAEEALEADWDQVLSIERTRVEGLMAMAAHADRPEDSRPVFRRLRELRDRLCRRSPEGLPLATLSMGMSGDFEVAIEEGATLVRVGSALWEGLA